MSSDIQYNLELILDGMSFNARRKVPSRPARCHGIAYGAGLYCEYAPMHIQTSCNGDVGAAGWLLVHVDYP